MLSEKLKTIRKKRGITQEEVAEFLRVKRQTYGAYERGVSTPDSQTLKKLADYFGVSTEYFFRDEKELATIVQSKEEERLLMLARRAEAIPPGQRERIIKAFEENIDLYIEAMNSADKLSRKKKGGH